MTLFDFTGTYDQFMQRTPATDGDGDGVPDGVDLCSGTGLGETVDGDGCSDSQVDPDGDGVCDFGAPSGGPSGCGGVDECLGTGVGEPVDLNGCAPSQLGTILVDKVTDPAGELDVFLFRLVAVPLNVDQSFRLSDASAPHSSGPLKPGNYLLQEFTPPEKWKSDPVIECEGASDFSLLTGDVLIRLKAGEVVTCTFINTLRASITIRKAVPGEDPQDFEFQTALGGVPIALVPGGIILDDDPSDGAHPRSITFNFGPSDSPLEVSELIPAGWRLDDLVCTDPDGGTSVDVPNATAFIDADPGELIVCIFVNCRVITVGDDDEDEDDEDD